ncbi:MAG TPA: hypothetical protein VEK08_08995 [Planctomycetota bacterium]|nr:hypothetical protein [Planctomycetota bacterium]
MKAFVAILAVVLLAGSAMAATTSNTNVSMTVESYVGITADASLLITGTPTNSGVTGNGDVNYKAYANVPWQVSASWADHGSKPAGAVITLGEPSVDSGVATNETEGTVNVSVTATLEDGSMSGKALGTVTLTIAAAN